MTIPVNISPSDASRALNSAKKPVTKTCCVCGTRFQGYARRSPLDGQERAYCSSRCKLQAHRARRRELAAADA